MVIFFCTESQIQEEMVKFAKQIYKTYIDFGFDPDRIEVKIALRPEQRIGSDGVLGIKLNLPCRNLCKKQA